MDVEKTVDEAINDLADILYGKEGATVSISTASSTSASSLPANQAPR